MLALVGRGVELAELTAAMEEARAGNGRLVLVSGEPGIGKTALVEALARMAAGVGVPTVWGRCWEGGGAAPFWPWTQAVRAALLDRPQLVESLGDAALDLAQLVPELSARSPAGRQAEDPDARFRLFDAVTTALPAAATGTALVVAIDDLHAADEGSLELLRYAMRDLATAPLLIAGTFRDADLRASPRRERLLATAARLTRTIRLRGLDEAEVGELLDRTAAGSDRGVAHLVHEATDGNPFLVQEAMRLVTENRHRAGGTVELPTRRATWCGAGSRPSRPPRFGSWRWRPCWGTSSTSPCWAVWPGNPRTWSSMPWPRPRAQPWSRSPASPDGLSVTPCSATP